MANLQVKNVPADIYRKLRRSARTQGRTIRDLVLEAVRRDLARSEFRERMAEREPVQLGRPAARSLEAARRERDLP